MAEAALVLAVRSSARMLAVLRLRFYVVLLKPAQNKVPEEPRQQQNTERPKSYFPHHSLCWWSSGEKIKTSRKREEFCQLNLRCCAWRARSYGSFRLAEVSIRRLTLAVKKQTGSGTWAAKRLNTLTRTFRPLTPLKNRGHCLEWYMTRELFVHQPPHFNVKLA